ncbi:hypothetical protein HFP15_36580 [Amycolatopsis sp. K13G38]|uniref:Uncharacterized protein n=1 Tax=Amycolatopsis acididurans TaxID=2724524 RepID=A0ABX1JF74_9PSEU|nr:hypothetical protein [Amycolatopsis acididurans]NKQ58383.1 hypothetical protein [Amycolatopsis acididurans]
MRWTWLLAATLGLPLLWEFAAVARHPATVPLLACSVATAGAAWLGVRSPLAGTLLGTTLVLSSALLAPIADHPGDYPRLATLTATQITAAMVLIVLLVRGTQAWHAAAGVTGLAVAGSAADAIGYLYAHLAHTPVVTNPATALGSGVLAVGLATALGLALRATPPPASAPAEPRQRPAGSAGTPPRRAAACR